MNWCSLPSFHWSKTRSKSASLRLKVWHRDAERQVPGGETPCGDAEKSMQEQRGQPGTWLACLPVWVLLITLNRAVWFGAKGTWKPQNRQQSPIHGFRTWESTIPWLFEAGDGLDQTGTISWGTGSLHSASTQKVDILGWRSVVAGCCFWLKDELGPSSFGGWFQESL